MKKFITHIVSLLLLVIVTDYAVGKVLDYVGMHPKGGDTARHNYINYGTNEDILIFGSSRAIHHYDPRILEDSLQMSVYNCGTDGNGAILFYMQLCNILERYTPKAILYDIQPGFDYNAGDDNSKYLGYMRRYYGNNPQIDSVFWMVHNTERYKMWSHLYRHNSMWLPVISDAIHPNHGDIKGYRPLEGCIPYDKELYPKEGKTPTIDSLKYYCMERFVQMCQQKGVKLIFLASPMYQHWRDPFSPVYTLAKKYNVPFINHYQDTAFVAHKEMFQDATHMNHVGAEEYTKMISDTVRKVLNTPYAAAGLSCGGEERIQCGYAQKFG